MPKELIVDNHPGFTSEFFSQVFKAFDCKKTHGTSYKSRSTGRAENSNKHLNQAMRTILPKGKETQWDLYTRYPIVARALGRVRRASKGILHTTMGSLSFLCHFCIKLSQQSQNRFLSKSHGFWHGTQHTSECNSGGL